MNSLVSNLVESSVSEPGHGFEWRAVADMALPFLTSIRSLFDEGLEIFVPADNTPVTRVGLDGTWFLRGTVQGFPLALVWNDFRVNGASTSKAVAATFIAFLDSLTRNPRPLLIGVKSMGVRFMEGRTVFPHAFSILPALNRYRRHNLVITLAHGNALGLGTLIFGMGHYRIAVREDSCINLTGPEVCKMVFGKQVRFEQIASNDIQFKNTGLIHELCDTLDAAFTRLPHLLPFFMSGSEPTQAPAQPATLDATDRFIAGICDDFVEVFRQYDERIRAYIGVIDGKPVGLLINPPDNANNMIRARSLGLVEDALNLFELLRLPVASMVDTPGADPRMDGNNRQIIEKLISASQKIIEYPYPKMGFVINRSYGGASVIAIPKFFGGEAVYALEGAHMGVMHESIITQLLSGSARLGAQWLEVSATQTADLKDMIDGGHIEGIIQYGDIRARIEQHLLAQDGEIRVRFNRRQTDAPGRFLPTTRHHPPREEQDSHLN